MVKAFVCAIALLFSAPCSAATVFMDISDLAGFTRTGGIGVAGNGFIWTSPLYSFAPGTTINFGTATVEGDTPDLRQQRFCEETASCFGNPAAFESRLLTDGVGGFDPFEDLSGILSLCGPNTTGMCEPSIFSLLITLGLTNNGVQLAFQGSDLHIDPPSPVPIPPPAVLLITGLGLLGSLGWRRRKFSK